jgi:EAL domain-containing protein (putative c-di-GMP-specific phosphodiesterase class I)
MHQRSARQLQLETALRRALERSELHLHYQPQLTPDGQIVGVEALLRWQHPELGPISPAEFVPLAEGNGQIIQIGAWVMTTAARQMKRWMDDGLPRTVIAVNLSAVQFRDPHLPQLVQQVLTETGLPADCLELELTESVATGSPNGLAGGVPTAAIAMMDSLHALGVRLSIDDFGTGWSSLNYLKGFRIHNLKIDQSFIRDICSDPVDRAIVLVIVQLAHALKLKTIAEGVETDEQFEFLRRHGCDILQGYRFCKPMEPEAALAWMREFSRKRELQSA